ncbi:hypothetical protein RhiirA4_488781 [Rhizophagus irregularis]|uniref:Uncharacterized protein n=1 Tax=Rhizophagus irregularis TaxID=588596 RepID=A0A2I1HU59_9GLOM|nr:hypothetical protein RhiirA4_488781 [Rhizophagus irregularis]
MAPKTRKSNQKEAAAKTQQSKQNEVNRGKGRASQKRVRNKITDNNNEKNSDDNINHNERESDLLGNFSDNREESLENLSDDDNNDNNDVFFLQASKYISDIVKEVLGDNQDYQDSFEPIQTGKNSSLTTSEAITPSRGRTSSLVPEATTPIRAGRIASLVPDVVTPPRTRSILSLLLGDDEPLPASFTEMSNILEQIIHHQTLNMVMNSLHGNGNLIGMVGENKAHLWDEESKCLFLHIRNPSSSDLDNFILAVFGYQPCSEMAKATFQETRKRLGDFRNKFNSTLRGLVDELKESRRMEGNNVNTMPSQSTIEQFISEDVV